MATRDYGHHLRQTHLFSASQLESLCQAILSSPLLGPNPLNHYFRTTRGYSLVFRRDGREELTARFPEFAPFLAQALSPMANAFYLNPLVIPEGGFVHRHADYSLRSYAPAVVHPMFVSVLYVQVPSGMSGGRFHLVGDTNEVLSVVEPEPGLLVTFRGDLRHEVTPVTETVGALRVSVVCEQYALDPEALAGVPRLHVQAAGGFASLVDWSDGASGS